MSRPPHDLAPSSFSTYFLTIVCAQKRVIFQVEKKALLFIDTLKWYREQRKFQVHEFVVMPNHVHLLISPLEGVTLERAVQFLKGGFSYRLSRQFGYPGEIWQPGYVDHRIRDPRDYEFHRCYIRANPVRARLCSVEKDFPYSSANLRFNLDPVPQGLKPLEASA